SQMRLNAFFVKPTISGSTSTVNAAAGETGQIPNSGSDSSGSSDAVKAEKKPLSDYEQEFPPFFLQSHVTLAPPHRFERDLPSINFAREKLDSIFKKDTSSEQDGPALKYCPSELFDVLPYKRRQGKASALP
ncbi:hypothetical protein ACJ72_05409, partial [Emergomyces africanus]